MLTDKLLTKKSVAQIINVHPQTLMRLVREGSFPEPIRIAGKGSALRWREQDIKEWIAVRKNASYAAAPMEAALA